MRRLNAYCTTPGCTDGCHACDWLQRYPPHVRYQVRYGSWRHYGAGRVRFPLHKFSPALRYRIRYLRWKKKLS